MLLILYWHYRFVDFPWFCFNRLCAIASISLMFSEAVASMLCSDPDDFSDAIDDIDAEEDGLVWLLLDGCWLLWVRGGGGPSPLVQGWSDFPNLVW